MEIVRTWIWKGIERTRLRTIKIKKTWKNGIKKRISLANVRKIWSNC